MATPLVTLAELEDAREVVLASELLHPTPFLHKCEHLSSSVAATGATVSLKLESLQTMGSFKSRGVVAMLGKLPADIKERGLVSMSAGNFGLSFAFCCAKSGIKCHLCMPDSAPKDRIAKIEAFGCPVEVCAMTELKATVEAHVQTHGSTFAHPFDDKTLFSGYGSIGFEIMECVPDVDVVVVCVGGGGLLSGIASAMKLKGTGARIVGVEPEGSPSMWESLKEGHAVTLKNPKGTIATGLAPPFAGTLCYEHVKAFVDDVVLVTDDEIRQAMRVLFNDCKVVAEPSGAAAVAALISGKLGDLTGKNVVCTVSGGNVDAATFSSIIAEP